MKLNKRILKEAIKGVLNEVEVDPAVEPAQKQTSREKRVETGLETGGLMSAEEYANTLKQVLLSKQVSNTDRKKALVAVFGNKASMVLGAIVAMMKGA